MPALPVPARDALVPGALLLLGTAELVFSGLPSWGWAWLCLAVACALLVVRRRLPLWSGCLAAAAVAVPPFIEPKLDDPATPIAILVVACYGFARYRTDLHGVVGLVLILLVQVPRYVFIEAGQNDITDVVFVGALLVPPFVFGRVARRLDEQTRQIEQQQIVLREQAIRAERDRIARELHDVIAHSVSAMVVQTAAAQDLIRSDPVRAQDLLAAVAATGRRALSETARLLHVIRDDADELGLAPVPGLADLDRLAEDFREAGMRVELDRHGDLTGLPAGVDVSAYRIVQEALTNARRYGAGTVTVRLARDGDQLRIAASNDVADSPRMSHQGAGLGLLGMGERASLLGGTLRHASSDGHFELEAVLPVTAT